MSAPRVFAVTVTQRAAVRRWNGPGRAWIRARFVVTAFVLALGSSCESRDDWLPATVTSADAHARVVNVTPDVAGTARIWRGHNFRFEKGGAWLLDGDERAEDYCATGVTWRFPPSDHRIWKDMGLKAGMCGSLKQFRKAEVMWTR